MGEILKKPCFVVLILITIGLLTLAMDTETQVQASTNELVTKNKRTILDVSSFVFVYNHKYKQQNPTLLDIWPNESFSFYFDVNVNLDECQTFLVDPMYGSWQKYPCALVHSLDGVAVIVNGNAMIKDILILSANMRFTIDTIENVLTTKTTIVESVIFLLAQKNKVSCDCTKQILKFSNFVEKKLAEFKKRGIKVWLEFNTRFLECCEAQKTFDLFRIVEHVVLRVELTRTTTVLSYGLFLNMINGHVERFEGFVDKFNSNSALYYKIDMSNDWKKDSGEVVAAQYDALVVQYLTTWTSSSEHTGMEIYILQPNTSNFSAAENNRFLKEHVTAAINTGQESFFDTNACHEQFSECRQILNIMHSVVYQLLLINPSLSLVSEYQIGNQKLIHESNCARTSLFFNQHDVNLTEVTSLMNQVLSCRTCLNISVVYFDPRYKWQADNDQLLNRISSKNIGVGCYWDVGHDVKNLQIFGEDVIRNCGRLWNMSSHVLLGGVVDVKTEKDLIERLSNLHEIKLAIENMYPNKTVTPAIIILSVSAQNISFSIFSKISPNFVYCDHNLTLWNEYHQALLTFAKIHRWNELVTMNIIDQFHDFGFWRNVETNGDIDRSATNFPLLYRSNAEKSINGMDLPMTYKCVQQTQTVDIHGINFLKNPYSGATFSAKLRKTVPLTKQEVERLLLFAFYRFPFVEMREVNGQELKHADRFLTRVVDTIQSIQRVPNNTDQPLIYFEILFQEATKMQFDLYNLKAPKYSAVHFSGWENHTTDELVNVLPVLSKEMKFPYKFGITVQNCSREINTGLTNLNQLPFVSMIDYVVCNTKLVMPDNSDRTKMQKYLDTLFYTKSYIEHILSSDKKRVEVMFRINLISGCPETPRDIFLRFINDVHQHSVAFKIKYFIVPAFETQDWARKCPLTWWRIIHYSDLNNTHVYVDREKEYLGLPTYSINITEAAEDSEQPSEQSISSFNLYLTATLSIGAIAVVVLLALWIQRRHLKNRFLSQIEIRQFYNGGEGSGDMIMMESMECFDSNKMKFTSNYEVPTSQIETREILGSGQFGVVYKGILSKQEQVAVKIPRSDCGKEQFKSSLSELKILCYIGKHENIVSFLGAYTKEIATGKLLIVTEYCENGSLISHLRRLGALVTDRLEDSAVDLYQFYRFAHQISSGMEYVGEKRIIHGDLAARNVLLTTEYNCKIADFGMSRRLYELNEYKKTSTELMPWRWMAPEALNRMEFTTKSDVWSFGVTLWEIFSLGKVPYPGKSWTSDFGDELENGMRMGKAMHASDEVHQKILQCWMLRRDERPTFTELRQYFAQLMGQVYEHMQEV